MAWPLCVCPSVKVEMVRLQSHFCRVLEASGPPVGQCVGWGQLEGPCPQLPWTRVAGQVHWTDTGLGERRLWVLGSRVHGVWA